MISNDLTSTPSVFSSLVLGLLHDDTPILDESIPPMETMMAMVEEDAPPTWYHQVGTSPTTHERRSKGNIGDGASLVPLVDIFPMIACMMLIHLFPCFMLVRLPRVMTYLFMMNMMMSMLSCLVMMLCSIGYHVKILLVTSCLTIH